jgi:hypothetical protein
MPSARTLRRWPSQGGIRAGGRLAKGEKMSLVHMGDNGHVMSDGSHIVQSKSN